MTLNLVISFWILMLCHFVPFKIGYEFDFVREANAMEKIRRFLYENNKKTPVLVPRVIRDMVGRYRMLQPVVMWSGLAKTDLDDYLVILIT